MSEWKWQVPKYEGSKWHGSKWFKISGNSPSPTVNIFCEHETEEVFLFGSFSNMPSNFVIAGSKADGKLWKFTNIYLSGDGYWFTVKNSSSDMEQFLIGNELVDIAGPLRKIEDERKALDESDALNAREKREAEKKLAKRYAQIVSEPRRRKTKFQCPECGYALVVRHETVQPILSQLWAAGIREISTRGLATLLRR